MTIPQARLLLEERCTIAKDAQKEVWHLQKSKTALKAKLSALKTKVRELEGSHKSGSQLCQLVTDAWNDGKFIANSLNSQSPCLNSQ